MGHKIAQGPSRQPDGRWRLVSIASIFLLEFQASLNDSDSSNPNVTSRRYYCPTDCKPRCRSPTPTCRSLASWNPCSLAGGCAM